MVLPIHSTHTTHKKVIVCVALFMLLAFVCSVGGVAFSFVPVVREDVGMTKLELADLTAKAMVEAGYDALFEVAVNG